MRVIWRRLFIFPRARVTSLDGQVAQVEVAGLVCDLCAARVRRGLSSLPQVEDVTVDLERGQATALLRGPVEEGQLAQAVEKMVIWPWARRLLSLMPFLGRR
ncbi:MAG: heavy metal-associated domain-containing protein [Dehalococcoidia bacterium]|jgi:copper chaperone CopZ|nr:heavy metal-associated domain-containing protein [Dehalococcoidia bacterium]